MDHLVNDLRHGFRLLLTKPGFAAVAILTLALGIGANTAIFSVVHAVILRPLPYSAPDRLVLVKEWIPKAIPDPIPVCAPDVIQFQRENKSFEGLAGFIGNSLDLVGGTEPLRVHINRVNANLFSILGVQPVLGRAFLSEEDQPGRRVAILSYGLWQKRFGGAPDIVGRSLVLDRESYSVVGVMPRSFVFPLPGMSEQVDAADLFIPMAFTKQEMAAVGDNFNYSIVGRLKASVSLAQANADVKSIAQRIQETYPAEVRSQLTLDAVTLPLAEQVVGKIRTLLLLLLGAVGFVLLISCINVANLLLTRATDRQKEIAVRLALGAGRARLMYQMISESLLLTLSGAALGLAFAVWITRTLVALMPASIPRVHEVGLNWTVLAFTLSIAILTGIVFGIAPALIASRTDFSNNLKEGGRSQMQGPQHHRIRGTLVVTEVALAMILLVGAGLLLRSFHRVLETDPGFQPEHVLTASLNLPERQYKEPAQIRSFYRELIQRTKQIPGSTMSGASTDLPLEAGWNHIFTPEGYEPPPGANMNFSNHSVILGSYLQAMGIPLIRGRYFTDQDDDKSTPVLIVSESLARHYWPNGDAIGKRLKWGPASSMDHWLTVVGIVGDVKQGPLDVETAAHTYQPFLQNPDSSVNVVVRAMGDAGSLASAVRMAVWGIDPQLAVAKVRTMDQVISESTSPRRFNLCLLGGFAALALVLSAIGIYGVISYSVAQRSHEIGIRMALGADHQKLMRWVLRQGLVLLAIGVAIGVVGALALTRSLASFLYGVQPTDPITFVGVTLILAAVAVLASYIPARRAARVDPMQSLRSE